MLLEFRTKNFKSFREEMTFKMTPAPKIKDLDYSVIKKRIKNKSEKILSTAVIYGPNASGKTNIIGAMEVLKNIIINGHIHNTESQNYEPNFAKYRLELIPNIHSQDDESVDFNIKFIEKNMIFEYTLKLLLGKFLKEDSKRKIIEEKLCINNTTIYERKRNNISIQDIEKKIGNYLINNFEPKISIMIAQNNLEEDELFLTGIFKTIFSRQICDIIVTWFKERFITVYRADAIEYNPKIKINSKIRNKINKEGNNFFINKELSEAVKNFGVSCTEIAYPVTEKEEEMVPISFISFENEKKEGTVLPAPIYESYGTIRFLNTFPMILDAIKIGRTVVVDEFDASMHPMAIMSIIKLFHNDEINKKGAQLVFNTHNPIFLNNNLFRRDEIHFVERDVEKGMSEHYILSDFGTNGINGVRNTEDYMEKYFVNKYGAIKEIDFTDIFLK